MSITTKMPSPPRMGPLLAMGFVLWLTGCASSTHRAPVEERAASARTPTVVAAAATAASAAVAASGAGSATTVAAIEAAPAKPLLPGAENAGKPGYHTVRPGDTLVRLGLEYGQNWRDIARWSGLENPHALEVGRVVRVAPPTADANGVVVRPVLPAGRVDGKPVAPVVPVAGASAPSPGASSAPLPVGAAASAAADSDENIDWAWPAAGPVITPFDEVKSKGLRISGVAGDPVRAAAGGRVVYAGSGLRGYGNLVIVKHNATFLSAYAHNQTLLVKEDQVVSRGQRIAEMGSSDAERVQLHFEIRREGKPVDPARLLPPR